MGIARKYLVAYLGKEVKGGEHSPAELWQFEHQSKEEKKEIIIRETRSSLRNALCSQCHAKGKLI